MLERDDYKNNIVKLLNPYKIYFLLFLKLNLYIFTKIYFNKTHRSSNL